MTRKHFKLIADVLREAHSHPLCQGETIDRLAEEFADALKHTNPNFKKDKFLRACGFTQDWR
jgi:hypothetical protein